MGAASAHQADVLAGREPALPVVFQILFTEVETLHEPIVHFFPLKNAVMGLSSIAEHLSEFGEREGNIWDISYHDYLKYGNGTFEK
ncbi:MAG: hypothetical protein ANABAC_1633 [Anaerolineae bacterium]|jgi:hypothetical protein|nr:MAG: hypothetical protein ANABAC_1633 [Anaerolineae bacterium]